MLLASLAIRRFRSIAELDWAPSAGLNLICGANGSGKTTVLEAIHMGLLGRSFRTSREEECIPWPAPTPTLSPTPTLPHPPAESPPPSTYISLSLLRAAGPRDLRLVLGPGWKRAYDGESLLPRLADLWGAAAVVAFTPDDVDLFRSPPARRRKFIDLAFCQSSRLYFQSLSRYHRALKQAGALLRSGPPGAAPRSEIDAFYRILAESGAELMIERRARLASLARLCSEAHARLGGAAPLEISYEPNLKNERFASDDPAALAAEIAARLAERHEESCRLRAVVSGPHRDDLRALLSGQDLARYGSQGQHRLAALSLKLASAELLRADLSEPPILLLDDFGSELDVGRRAAVLASLRGRMQTFVTATRPEDLGPAAAEFEEIRAIESGAWA